MDLPSSYIGKSGQVMYFAEVCLKFHKSNNELRQKIPFTVNGILDLNTEPGAAQSVEVRKYKHLCCLCCRTGPVGFKLMIDRKGFVPGESLKFTMEINNQSRRHVSGVCLQLMQTVQFHAKKNTSEDLRIIRKIKGPQAKPGETETWTEKTFQIPPIPPSRLANCAIIDVQYSLEIEMKISGIGKNIKGSIPIVIGTIPFRRMFETINSRNSQNISSLEGIVTASTSKKLAPPRPIGPPVLLEAYPDLPPPSYAEAINISEGGGRTNAVGLNKKSYESYAKVSGSAPIPRSGNENLGFDFEEAFVPNYVIYA